MLFSGDTLFNGGPGATGRSWSDYPTIINSIRASLLTLPPETVVLTGHGDATTIGAEAANFQPRLSASSPKKRSTELIPTAESSVARLHAPSHE